MIIQSEEEEDLHQDIEAAIIAIKTIILTSKDQNVLIRMICIMSKDTINLIMTNRKYTNLEYNISEVEEEGAEECRCMKIEVATICKNILIEDQ